MHRAQQSQARSSWCCQNSTRVRFWYTRCNSHRRAGVGVARTPLPRTTLIASGKSITLAALRGARTPLPRAILIRSCNSVTLAALRVARTPLTCASLVNSCHSITLAALHDGSLGQFAGMSRSRFPRGQTQNGQEHDVFGSRGALGLSKNKPSFMDSCFRPGLDAGDILMREIDMALAPASAWAQERKSISSGTTRGGNMPRLSPHEHQHSHHVSRTSSAW